MQKDNSTLRLKALLRTKLLAEIKNPIVMETHGGYGGIWAKCYFGVEDGVVMEKDPDKAAALAKQRPTWAVYECDCVNALRAGVGSHLSVNFLDLDPYGEPWPVVDAFFQSERQFPPILAIAVNDGLRQKVKINGGWDVRSLADVVERYGSATLYKKYLDVCQEMVKEKAGQRGYTLTRWAGYYCGHADQMTHYAAILKRGA